MQQVREVMQKREQGEAVDSQQHIAAVLLWRMAAPLLRYIFRNNNRTPADLFMAWKEQMVVDDNNIDVVADADLLRVRGRDDGGAPTTSAPLLLTLALSGCAGPPLQQHDRAHHHWRRRRDGRENEYLPLLFLDFGADPCIRVADMRYDQEDVPAFVGKQLTSYEHLAREMGLSNPPTPFVMPGDREAAAGADERKLMEELMRKHNFDPHSTAEARSFETLLSIWTERVHTESASKLAGHPSLHLRMYVHPRRAPAAPLSNTPSHISLPL